MGGVLHGMHHDIKKYAYLRSKGFTEESLCVYTQGTQELGAFRLSTVTST